MRAAWALGICLLLLPLPAHPAAAQESPGLVTDDLGDVAVAVQGNAAPPAGRFEAVDLKGLRVAESEDALTFTLQVANLKANPEVPLLESASYQVSFLQNDHIFRVTFFRQFLTAAQYFAQAQGYDAGTGAYFGLGSTDAVTVDADAGSMSVTFPRLLFLDSNGNAPNPETPLTNWHVASFGAFDAGRNCRIGIGPVGNSCPSTTVRDAMPNEGNSTALLPLRFGIAQSGHARLTSPQPLRASDGEATTFVYDVTAHNLARSADTFSLRALNIPANWNVQLPADHVKVTGNGTVLFPVLATVPFAHVHGAVYALRLELQSTTDPATVGRIELGVRYTNPPQPTGHHNLLTLHSEVPSSDPLQAGFGALFGNPQNALYMNANDNDANDAQVEVPGFQCGLAVGASATPRETYCWMVPLSPALEIGLDFKLGEAGSITVPVKTLLPLQSAILSGYLARVGSSQDNRGPANPNTNRRETLVLADLVPHAAIDVGADSADNQMGADIVPRAHADYLPYVKGAGLMLVLNLSFLRVDPFVGPHDAPAIQPGGTLQLPLAEFHDRIEALFASNATVALTAAGATNRLVNPGKSVRFNLTLENRGREAADYLLQLTGANLGWASLRSPAEIHLEAGNRTRVEVDVIVPEGASQDAACDLILSAVKGDDLAVRALVRLLARVDTNAEHPDDGVGPLQNDAKRLPGPDFLLLAGSVLALAWLSRRRA